MAKDSNYVVGIDIGTSKILTVIGRIGEQGELEITGVGQAEARGMRAGVVSSLREVVESLKESIDEAELMAGYTIDRAYVNVGGCHVRGFNSRGVVAVTNRDRLIDRDDIQRVLDGSRTISFPQDQRIFHTFPQEYIVDNQDGITQPTGMTGSRLEVNVHIITGTATCLQNLATVVNRCGIEMAEPVLSLMADAQAVLTPDEIEIGVCLVDIGHGTTGISVFEKGSIWHTHVIPIGGEHFTNDLAVGLKTSIKTAEILKKKYGTALASEIEEDDMVEVPSVAGKQVNMIHRSRLAELLQSRGEELLNLVYEEIRSVGLDKAINAGLVLTGGGAALVGLPEVAETIFDHQVRVGEPMYIRGLTNIVASPVYATAVGLALYGAKNEAENPRGKQGNFLGRMWKSIKEMV